MWLFNPPQEMKSFSRDLQIRIQKVASPQYGSVSGSSGFNEMKIISRKPSEFLSRAGFSPVCTSRWFSKALLRNDPLSQMLQDRVLNQAYLQCEWAFGLQFKDRVGNTEMQSRNTRNTHKIPSSGSPRWPVKYKWFVKGSGGSVDNFLIRATAAARLERRRSLPCPLSILNFFKLPQTVSQLLKVGRRV